MKSKKEMKQAIIDEYGYRGEIGVGVFIDDIKRDYVYILSQWEDEKPITKMSIKEFYEEYIEWKIQQEKELELLMKLG
jgi:hypothetical protein